MSSRSSSIFGIVVIVIGYLFIWPLVLSVLPKKSVPVESMVSIKKEPIAIKGETSPQIIFFWATWCQVCEHQMPSMKNLDMTHDVIFVSSDSGHDNQVLSHIGEADASKRLYVNDLTGQLKSHFNIYGYPTTLIVQNNKIEFTEMGYVTEKQLRERLTILQSK